jgi:GT2 family glycosyltransferase
VSNPIDFSIIIPTRDRHLQLAACLEAIAGLGYPCSSFEVVVVDDGSKASVEPVVAPYRERFQITLRSQPGGGPALARNRGADVARGRFLAFTDDDCRPAPDWLDNLAACLNRAPNSIIGGRTVNGLKDNIFATASQALISYLYDYFNGDPKKLWFFTSSNLALGAESFRSVGGFDASYPRAAAEDRDLCDRLRVSGHSMVYAPDAVVYHLHPLNLLTFWSQQFGYGRGARRYWRAHRKRCGEDMRVEPPRFYSGMVIYPLRQNYIRNPLAVAALLLLSQVANVAGFLWERGFAKTQRRAAPGLERMS